MRLINTRTRKLEEFKCSPPPYAILSHRWHDSGEVPFHVIGTLRARFMPGYSKIRWGCAQAQRDGLDYFWIDTCCIDKRSSAELSEAINSMYAWYRDARVCYAYLHDVLTDEGQESESSPFWTSDWFKRGWTLQELLAPQNLIFFSKNWKMVGSKISLAAVLCKITSIEEEVLVCPENVQSLSVATRMSWASQRHTSKVEDRAYSLMGIFNVHMPIIYGEGEAKAFIRLQEEIMKTSTDQSILAWNTPSHYFCGPLAESPDYFVDCRGIHCIPPEKWLGHCARQYSHSYTEPRLDFTVTNDGLNITLPLRKLDDVPQSVLQPQGGYWFEAVLSCSAGLRVWDGRKYLVDLKDADLVRILLWQPNPHIQRYVRIYDKSSPTIKATATYGVPLRPILIGKLQSSAPAPPFHYFSLTFIVQYLAVQRSGYSLKPDPEPHCTVRPDTCGSLCLRTERRVDLGGHLQVARLNFHNSSSGERFSVVLGISSDLRIGAGPWVRITDNAYASGEETVAFVKMDWATWKLHKGYVNATIWEAEDNGEDADNITYIVTIRHKRHKVGFRYSFDGR